MLFTLIISAFFGLVAAATLVVNVAMVRRGARAARSIRIELAAIDRIADRVGVRLPSPVQPGRLAFA